MILTNINCDNMISTGIFINIVYVLRIFITNLTLSHVRSYTEFLMTAFFVDTFVNDSQISEFYPKFLYFSYSNMSISNSSFLDSFETFGSLQIVAITAEYNNSFAINNCLFRSLKNTQYGAVKFTIILFF